MAGLSVRDPAVDRSLRSVFGEVLRPSASLSPRGASRRRLGPPVAGQGGLQAPSPPAPLQPGYLVEGYGGHVVPSVGSWTLWLILWGVRGSLEVLKLQCPLFPAIST